MKRAVSICIIICLIGAAALGMYYLFSAPHPVVEEDTKESVEVEASVVKQTSDSETIEGDVLVAPDGTNARRAEMEQEIVADPRVVGKWCEADMPTHYRVYYDDACDEEGFFWAKEWNEDDDVYEEDLIYHGNGWFKWKMNKHHFIEIHIGDQNNLQVPIMVAFSNLSDSTLNLLNGGMQYRFQRMPE